MLFLLAPQNAWCVYSWTNLTSGSKNQSMLSYSLTSLNSQGELLLQQLKSLCAKVLLFANMPTNENILMWRLWCIYDDCNGEVVPKSAVLQLGAAIKKRPNNNRKHLVLMDLMAHNAWICWFCWLTVFNILKRCSADTTACKYCMKIRYLSMRIYYSDWFSWNIHSHALFISFHFVRSLTNLWQMHDRERVKPGNHLWMLLVTIRKRFPYLRVGF